MNADYSENEVYSWGIRSFNHILLFMDTFKQLQLYIYIYIYIYYENRDEMITAVRDEQINPGSSFWGGWCISALIIFTNPCAGNDTRSIFKRSLTGLNSKFSFSYTSCLTKAEEPSLPYYLPIAGGRIIGFIPFPRVLVLCEMQSVTSRIWTRVAVSISYDDNDYTTGTSSISALILLGKVRPMDLISFGRVGIQFTSL